MKKGGEAFTPGARSRLGRLLQTESAAHQVEVGGLPSIVTELAIHVEGLFPDIRESFSEGFEEGLQKVRPLF